MELRPKYCLPGQFPGGVFEMVEGSSGAGWAERSMISAFACFMSPTIFETFLVFPIS